MDIKAIIERANEFMSKDDIAKPILEEAVKEATERAESVVERRVDELKELVAGIKEVDSLLNGPFFLDIIERGKLVSIVPIRTGEFYDDNPYIYLTANRQDYAEVGRLKIEKDKKYVALVVVIEKE